MSPRRFYIDYDDKSDQFVEWAKSLKGDNYDIMNRRRNVSHLIDWAALADGSLAINEKAIRDWQSTGWISHIQRLQEDFRKALFVRFHSEKLDNTTLYRYIQAGIRLIEIEECSGSVDPPATAIPNLPTYRISESHLTSIDITGRYGIFDLQENEIRHLDIWDADKSWLTNLRGGSVEVMKVWGGPIPGSDITIHELYHMHPDSLSILTGDNLTISFKTPRSQWSKVEANRKFALGTLKALSEIKSMEPNRDAIQQYYDFFESRPSRLKRFLFWFNRGHHALLAPSLAFVGCLLTAGALVYFDQNMGLEGLEKSEFLPPLAYTVNIPKLFTDILFRGFPPEDPGYWLDFRFYLRGLLKLGIGATEGLAAYSLFSFLAGLKKRFGYKKLA